MTVDISVALGVFLALPLIIWANYHYRDRGMMGYIWRESPNLARAGLVFLSLIWADAGHDVASYYGLISSDTSTIVAMVLGIPMFIFSVAIIIMGTAVFIRYLRSRRAT